MEKLARVRKSLLKGLANRKTSVIALCFATLVFALYFSALDNKKNLLSDYSFSKVFYDKQDKILRITLAHDDKYRIFTPLNEIATIFQDSVLLYEDKYFYYHPGFNPISLAQAFYSTYYKKGTTIGASTITMQLARLLKQINSRTISGKLQQIVEAVKLELLYSKAEILEAYLNLVPYGYNIEGIGAASLIYFKKQPHDLGIVRSLNLITIPQNPNKRTEHSTKNTWVKSLVFKQLVKKYPQYKDKESLIKIPLEIKKKLNFYAPHYTDYLNQREPYKNNYHTNLDLEKQQLLENIVTSYIKTHEHKGLNNTAALLLNWQNMEIESYIGSGDYFNDNINGQVNAIEARRSPGSSFKPFIYALAMQEGIIHPMTLLKDSPIRYSDYAPDNFDKKFFGPVLARDALIYSRNVPAVSLIMTLQKESFFEFLQDAHIKNLKSEEYYGTALALGAFEISMRESARLYAMLRNQGTMQSIKDFQDDTIESKKLLSPESAFLTLDILKDNPRVSNINNDLVDIKQKYHTAWKTGTSYAFKDAWSVGVFGPYVLVIWVGNFDGVGNNAFVGREAAAPLFFDIADNLMQREENPDQYQLSPNGLNLTKAEICETTGDLPGIYCPDLSYKWFIPGISPIKTSTIYRNIFIDNKTGLRACYNDPDTTHTVIYEFWDSDLRELFEKAGIYKRSPPPFLPECSLIDTSSLGKSPKIFLPVSNLVYVIREDSEQKTIPLKAIVDNDAKKLFWFANNSFIGTSLNNETTYWNNPKSGTYTIRAVDEMGRTAAREINVISK